MNTISKQRPKLNDDLLPMLEILDSKFSHETFPSLVPLTTRFPNLISPNQLQDLDKFKVLSTFMKQLLSLPHANADVERIFSDINLIKTNSRNRLHTSTVEALLIVKDGIRSYGNSVTFSPPKAVIDRMTADILYDTPILDELEFA